MVIKQSFLSWNYKPKGKDFRKVIINSSGNIKKNSIK
jgi:hypothetical protein